MKQFPIIGQHTSAVLLGKKMPKYQILCGSRLKPEMAIKTLKLSGVQHEDIMDGKQVGRVSIVTGKYRFDLGGHIKYIEILIGETGMGQSSVDITQAEFLSVASGEPVVQIRAGTAGGINSDKDQKIAKRPFLDLGDLVVADENIGHSGAIEQRLGYFRKVTPNTMPQLGFVNPISDQEVKKEVEAFLVKAYKYGLKPTLDGRFLRNMNDKLVTKALVDAAGNLGLDVSQGANFTKESLNGEASEEFMAMLRKRYGIMVSEMEQLTNAFLAKLARVEHGIKAYSGMIVAVIGAVPGHGFPDPNNREQMRKQEMAEEQTLKIAAEALVKIHKEQN